MSNIIDNSKLTRDEKRKAQILSFALQMQSFVKVNDSADVEEPHVQINSYYKKYDPDLLMTVVPSSIFLKEKRLSDMQYVGYLKNICNISQVSEKEINKIFENVDFNNIDQLYDKVRNAVVKSEAYIMRHKLSLKRVEGFGMYTKIQKGVVTPVPEGVIKTLNLSKEAVSVIEKQMKENSTDINLEAQSVSAFQENVDNVKKGAKNLVNKVKKALANSKEVNVKKEVEEEPEA